MLEAPKLTARQQQILTLIETAIAQTGAPPTRAEIATELGFKSANAAEEHLQALARKGMIELVSGTSRHPLARAVSARHPKHPLQTILALPSRLGPIVLAPDRACGRGLAHTCAGTCGPDLLRRKQPVSTPTRLPTQSARHVYA